MKCPSCAENTPNKATCHNCNVDITLYNKVHMMAARLYNKGLEQAQGRCLSAAIESLEMCIRLQKNHIEANNLLGVIYWEVGEIGKAMKYWLNSLSHQKDRNLAKFYLDKVKSSPTELKRFSDTMMLYNKSLEYFDQGSADIAIISLRKAISQNPNYVEAKVLLSLYYITNDQEEKAAELLKEVRKISKDHPRANQYWQSLSSDVTADQVSAPTPRTRRVKRVQPPRVKPLELQKPKPQEAQPESHKPQKPHKSEAVKANALIEPKPFKENIIAFVIGAICMLAVYAILIGPATTSKLKQEIKQAEDKEIQVQNKLDKLIQEQEETIATIEREKGALEKANQTLKKEQEIQQVALDLQNAQDLADQREWVEAAGKLENINKDSLGEHGPKYDELMATVYPRAGDLLYKDGYKEYQARNYAQAIALFEKSYFYAKEERYSDNALYMIGRSFEDQGETVQASQYYNSVEENYPGTDGAAKAQRRLRNLNR